MNDPLSIPFAIISCVLVAAMLLGLVRLALGPTTADRVVALDLVAITGVALMAAGVIVSGVRFMLDVGILLALIGFVGTAAFAGYIERKDRGWP